jgi:hypothetical protein
MLASTSTIKGSHKQSHSFFLQFSFIFQTFSFNFTEIVSYGVIIRRRFVLFHTVINLSAYDVVSFVALFYAF